uniref:Uncharacterized protein n=1 Tax=Heterosigma akashiwo TaxID=2829 RepID=A0A7S3XQ77_HETAK
MHIFPLAILQVISRNENYEIRRYGESREDVWTNAHIASDSWSQVQSQGFYKNFDYISGGNSEEMTIPMTAPVLFRRAPPSSAEADGGGGGGDDGGGGGGWRVSFFVPAAFPSPADAPAPLDADVEIVTSGARTYAALLFPGFAAEADWPAREAELRAALAADGVAVKPGDEEWGVVYAGYDSPFVLFNRHNEVWIEVEENAAIMLDK